MTTRIFVQWCNWNTSYPNKSHAIRSVYGLATTTCPSQASKHVTWYNDTCCILALDQNGHHITAVQQVQAQWYLQVCHKWLWHDMEVGTAWRICCISTSKHMQMTTCHAQLRSMLPTSSQTTSTARATVTDTDQVVDHQVQCPIHFKEILSAQSSCRSQRGLERS